LPRDAADVHFAEHAHLTVDGGLEAQLFDGRAGGGNVHIERGTLGAADGDEARGGQLRGRGHRSSSIKDGLQLLVLEALDLGSGDLLRSSGLGTGLFVLLGHNSGRQKNTPSQLDSAHSGNIA